MKGDLNNTKMSDHEEALKLTFKMLDQMRTQPKNEP